MAPAIGVVLSALLAIWAWPVETASVKALEDLDRQASEFPENDYYPRHLYLLGLIEKLATERLARAPDTVETLEILLRAKRLKDGLAVLRRIATNHPDRISTAFEALNRSGNPFQPDEGRGYEAALQQIIAIARRRLAELPREEAAWAARHMLGHDTSWRGKGGWKAARASLAHEYAGTEAASLDESTYVRQRAVHQRVLDPTELTYDNALRYRWHNNVDGFLNPESFAKARELLTLAYTQGKGLHRRKAMATLAAIYFYRRDYADARDQYTKYLQAYPRSPWAWVAALRVGQCAEMMGDWNGAGLAYRTALSGYEDVPVVRVLGHAFMARAWEALGRLNDARKELERALAAWDHDYGYVYSIQGFQRPDPELQINACTVRDPWEVSTWSISDRIAELQRSARSAEGVLLERGRWLFEQRRRREAWITLEALIATHPQSPIVPEARSLAHRARIEEALDLADVQGANPDENAALNHLDLVAEAPYDFGVAAAKIAKASILARRSVQPEAAALMTEALTEWHAYGDRLPRPAPSNGVARDLAEIRSLLFRPDGGGIFKGRGSWNGLSDWPPKTPGFFIVDPNVSVTLASREVVRLDGRQTFPHASSVLFMDAEQMALLTKIIDKIGGTARTTPASIMAIPSPAGASYQVLTLWKRFFPAMPGHWGGWLFYSFPILHRIEFLDERRTRALVPFRIGYEGGTVVLEKTGGRWTAQRLTYLWIE
jgi:tetratricopeptide (TPR) repeat protein